MRLAYLGFAPLILACTLLSAQQAAVSTPAADAPAQAVPATQQDNASAASSPAPTVPPKASQKDDDAIARGEAKAARRAEKDKAKADAKAEKEQEKQKKQAEADAKLLKLEDNEIAVAVFDDQGNPVKLPPCAKKDKSCQEKRKEVLKQHRVPLLVQNGTLTIDGLIGRARLNYDIPSFLYLYVSVPGYGTVVLSPVHFPYSTELKDALDGQTLTIATADDHVIQLNSESPISGKGKRSLFYSVDRDYQQPGRYPTIGYGLVHKAPYVWPGALPLTEDQRRRVANAPELPKGMEAAVAAVPCQAIPAGGSAKPVKVNGVTVIPHPCKPEVAGTPGASGTSQRPPDGSGAASTGIAEDHSRS